MILSMFCCLFIYCNGETVCVWNLVWINFNHFKGWFLFMHSTTYRKRSFFTLLKKLFLCNLNFCLPQRLLQLNMTTGLCEISIPVLKIEKKSTWKNFIVETSFENSDKWTKIQKCRSLEVFSRSLFVMSTKEQSLRTVIIAAVMIDLEYCN